MYNIIAGQNAVYQNATCQNATCQNAAIISSKNLSDGDRKNLVRSPNIFSSSLVSRALLGIPLLNKTHCPPPIPASVMFSIFYGNDHCGSEWFDDNEYKFPYIKEFASNTNRTDLENFVNESISYTNCIIDEVDEQILLSNTPKIVSEIITRGYFVANGVSKNFSIVFSSNWKRVAIFNEKNNGSIIRWRELDQDDPIIYESLFRGDYPLATYHIPKYFLYDTIKSDKLDSLPKLDSENVSTLTVNKDSITLIQ
jgi:hypothetical protein